MNTFLPQCDQWETLQDTYLNPFLIFSQGLSNVASKSGAGNQYFPVSRNDGWLLSRFSVADITAEINDGRLAIVHLALKVENKVNKQLIQTK